MNFILFILFRFVENNRKGAGKMKAKKNNLSRNNKNKKIDVLNIKKETQKLSQHSWNNLYFFNPSLYPFLFFSF